jgi:hypothetical protein
MKETYQNHTTRIAVRPDLGRLIDLLPASCVNVLVAGRWSR